MENSKTQNVANIVIAENPSHQPTPLDVNKTPLKKKGNSSIEHTPADSSRIKGVASIASINRYKEETPESQSQRDKILNSHLQGPSTDSKTGSLEKIRIKNRGFKSTAKNAFKSPRDNNYSYINVYNNSQPGPFMSEKKGKKSRNTDKVKSLANSQERLKRARHSNKPSTILQRDEKELDSIERLHDKITTDPSQMYDFVSETEK